MSSTTTTTSQPITPSRPATMPSPSSLDQSAPALINLAGNSTSWQSSRHDTLTKLNRLHNMATHIGVSSSPFFPKTAAEHVNHIALYKADCAAAEVRRMENHLAETKALGVRLRELKVEGVVREREKLRLKVGGVMGGKEFPIEGKDGGKTAVLAKKSIWGLGSGKRGVAWPRLEEFKAEGEMRARRGLERKLPLPKLNMLKEIERSEMVNSGDVGRGEVVKMEEGKMPMPFRMKVVAPVEEFDETRLGQEDHFARGLTKIMPKMREMAEEVDEREAREKGWLGDLLDGP